MWRTGMNGLLTVFWTLILTSTATGQTDWDRINIPDEHLPYFFRNNPDLRERCLEQEACPYKEAAQTDNKCWGYEDDCPLANRMLSPQCYEVAPSLKAWMSKYGAGSQEEVYWRQADFGFAMERREELTEYCTPRSRDGASLKCSTQTRYCKGRNIYMDFRRYDFGTSTRYSEEVFQIGELGGDCDVNREELAKQGEHKSPLQSWYAEVQNFSSLGYDPFKEGRCDVIIDKPTIVMKLDAGVNMYHHFCDYLNLYLSQHVDNNFDRDINIINWDTSYMKYGDFFGKTWEVFSEHPFTYLREYAGKRVCFRDIMFPLLARMRYGLYYNTPLIAGCKDTALFRAFRQHVLHRLRVHDDGPLKDKIRITFLFRGTKFRKVLNQDDIFKALAAVEEYDVQMVNYNHTIPFEEQLRISANSDIFMGMHGSGLTHSLFQPDWGAVFEIYNCDDVHCYKDLAHLRGLRYFTWEKPEHLVQEDDGHHPTLGAHKKFTNYSFNIEEFKRLVAKMVTYVKQHPSFRAARRLKFGKDKEKTEL